MSDDYIYIDENHRLGAEYDDSGENPREWDTPVGFVETKGNRDHIKVKSDYDFPGEIGRAYEAFEGANYVWAGKDGYKKRFKYYPAAEEITARWARIFYGIEVVWDDEEGGFWFVDPTSFAKDWTPNEDGTYNLYDYSSPESFRKGPIGTQTKAEYERALIDLEVKQYHAWGSGNVFYVYGQKRVIKEITVKEPDGGWTRQFEEEDWETEDSLSGIYSDDFSPWLTEAEVRAVANENFGDEYHSELARK